MADGSFGIARCAIIQQPPAHPRGYSFRTLIHRAVFPVHYPKLRILYVVTAQVEIQMALHGNNNDNINSDDDDNDNNNDRFVWRQ